MASPPVPVPSSLLVKRKRDEAPVDSLYVQQQDDSKKRRLAEPAPSFYFKRVCSSAPVSDHTSPVSTPQPEPADSRNIRIGDSISARTSPAPSSLLAPRRFLLSRPPSAPPSILAGSGGIKSRKRKKDNVAVFVEQRVAPLLRVEEASGFVEEGEKEERKLKRPNSHAVKIQKPKSEDVSEPVVSGEGEKIEQNKQELPAAFAELLAEEEKEEQSLKSPAPKLKYQPHAVPRYRDRHPSSAKPSHQDDDAMDLDDGDYVYDTYIREPLHIPPSVPTSNNKPGPISIPNPMITQNTDHSQPSTPGGTIGYLILPASGTDELWESYLSSSPTSSEGFDTDDEDSNAEDFYGNDYPEDEMASDDEMGEGAYRYGRENSDDEQWGYRKSDEEDEEGYEGSVEGGSWKERGFGRRDKDDDPFGTGDIGKPIKLKGAGYSVW